MNVIFHKLPILKKLSSLLVVLVFALSITPKITLHKWFANHIDSTFKIPNGNTTQISKAGFNCKCDDLVAESHFMASPGLIIINIGTYFPLYSFYIPTYYSVSLFYNYLRGPPVSA